MDTQHDIALAHALTGIPGPLPPAGVIHLAIPHTSRFTVVGNHLAQHTELSLTAIGIGVHIQSLPIGSKVGIKALTARFTEGETRIASALRELETHGYLYRTRVRPAHGRVVTRTVFCNQPGALLRGGATVPPTPVVAAPLPVTAARTPVAAPSSVPVAVKPLPVVVTPVQVPVGTRGVPVVAAAVPESAPVPEDAHPPVRVPSRTTPKPPRPSLPQPRELTPELRQTSATLLADLRRHAKELVLSEKDVDELIPGVAAWLERDAHPEAIRHALTTELPQPPKYPAKIVRHRLTALLPPQLPGTEDLAPRRRATATPFQTCEGCDRAFRSPHPGHCRDCRAQYGEAA
ncbi:hypothetical protein [Streptomyces sp. NPDC006270]|uniref:hypothetical protein n=1 Tax=Streptomyces sp. NPDC006270 TaxID=3364741 RepID=UPI0036C271B2